MSTMVVSPTRWSSPSMARVRLGDAPLQVGLVGYGLGGSAFHAPFVATTPGLELAAIVTRDPERQRQAARDYPGVRIVAEVERLWDRSLGLDVVVISTPNRTHVPLALSAIDAEMHVVVDKPLAPSVKEGRAVVDEARRRGVVLSVFQNRRWDGDFKTVRRLLADGALGAPLRFESGFERWRPDPTGTWRERGTPEDAGGLLFDLGSHLIDQALVLFGPAIEVYAELDRRRPGVEADDDGFVALTHASGVRSHLRMSAVAAQAAPRFRVLGTAAAYTKWGVDVQEAALRAGERPGKPDWGMEPPELWGTLGVGDEVQRVPTERGDYGAFYAGLVRAVRSEAPPPVNPADAVAALEVIEAAQVSAQQRTVVRP
jgi:predicted dehydrogenase